MNGFIFRRRLIISALYECDIISLQEAQKETELVKTFTL